MEGKDRNKARMRDRAARIVTTMDPAMSRWSSVFSSSVVDAHGSGFDGGCTHSKIFCCLFKFIISAD